MESLLIASHWACDIFDRRVGAGRTRSTLAGTQSELRTTRPRTPSGRDRGPRPGRYCGLYSKGFVIRSRADMPRSQQKGGPYSLQCVPGSTGTRATLQRVPATSLGMPTTSLGMQNHVPRNADHIPWSYLARLPTQLSSCNITPQSMHLPSGEKSRLPQARQARPALTGGGGAAFMTPSRGRRMPQWSQKSPSA